MLGCHICGGDLYEFKNFNSLYQVTSDCRPWRKDGRLCVCTDCATLQKPVDKKWMSECQEIYESYDIYSQANGVEQNAFALSSGIGEARSKK